MFILITGMKIKLPIIVRKLSCKIMNSLSNKASIIAKIKLELGPAIEIQAASLRGFFRL